MTKRVQCLPVTGIPACAADVNSEAVFRAGRIFLRKLIMVLMGQRVCEIGMLQLISANRAIMPCVSSIRLCRLDDLIYGIETYLGLIVTEKCPS